MAHRSLSAGAFALVLLQCGSPGQQQAAPNRAQPASGEVDQQSELLLRPAAGDTGDEEIAGVLLALDDGWSDQARLALGRARDPRVKAFAGQMLEHRGLTSEAVTSLEPDPVESPLSEAVDSETGRAYARLLAEGWRRFDESFLDEQIRSFEDALTLIDERLMPRAQDEEIETLLADYSAGVSAQLERARELRVLLE